jgi:hypothetical protein
MHVALCQVNAGYGAIFEQDYGAALLLVVGFDNYIYLPFGRNRP